MEIIGYSFNADTFCLECTEEYTDEQIKTIGLEKYKMETALEHFSLEEKTLLVKDFGNNDLHAMFDIDEYLQDVVCGSWKDETHEVYIYEIDFDVKYEMALKDLKEELNPFFEDLDKSGSSIFDTSRVFDVEKYLNLDDHSFQDELFEYLEDKFNCYISSNAVDMGSFVVIHNDWYIDENGNCFKKPILDHFVEFGL